MIADLAKQLHLGRRLVPLSLNRHNAFLRPAMLPGQCFQPFGEHHNGIADSSLIRNTT